MFFSRRQRNRKLHCRRSHVRFEALESRRVLATYFVDSTADNDVGFCAADNAAGNIDCTIRSAVDAAEANPGNDTIQIPDGNYSTFIDVFSSSAQDFTFVGNAANPAAVVITAESTGRVVELFADLVPVTVSFQGLTLQDGRAADGSGGGGINANSDVNLILDQLIIQNNTAAENDFVPGQFSSGGGIQASGNVTITNSTIQDNTATINGGGIDYRAADDTKLITISNSTFSGNTATSVGGGIHLRSSDTEAVIDNVTFTNNEGPDSGGGIYSDGAEISVSNSTFTGNRATAALSGGGGLYILGGPNPFSVTNTNFQNNQAVDGAGGLEVVDVAGSIDGGTFANNFVTGIGNTFDQGGGGIVIIGNQVGSPPAVSISGVTVQGNTAPAAGGIAVVDANLTISDSLIQNNNATNALIGGGGIGAVSNVVGGSPLTIQRTRVLGNQTAGEGAGIGSVDVTLQISDTTINGNSANGGRAGGIGIIGNLQTPVAMVSSTTISNNLADSDGGGIGIDSAALQLSNVTITANTAFGTGGGIAYDNDNGTVQSTISFSTIADNSGLVAGNNLVAQGTAAIEVSDSIFAAGDCVFAPGSFVSAGFNIDSGSSCGFALPTDRSNTDPVLGTLQDNGGPVLTLALGPGSPAIDTASLNFPATDARGFARPQDGNGDLSSEADIGAFEALAIVQPRLTIGDVFFEESSGAARVLVTLDLDTGGPFTVDFTTADGSATNPGDYLTNSGTLNFNGTAGEQQAILITLVDDNVTEADEQFQVTLSSPSTGVDVSDIGNVSIFDDDTATLSVDDPSVNEDSGTVTVTVTLSGQSDESFTVDVATLDLPNGAVAGTDYTANAGTLTFAGNNGETQSFTVNLTADTIVELDEAFRVEITGITAGTRDIQFDNFADRVDISALGQFSPGGISANDVAIFTPDPFTTIAYVADASGLLVLDVSDPTAIVQLGAFALADEAFQVNTVDVAFFDGVVYIAAGDAGLEVLDVSDPTNINRLGSFSVAGQRAVSLDRSGGIIYLGETDATQSAGGLRILDASDPTNITQLGFFQTDIPEALGVRIDGTTAYVAASVSGLQILDVSDPGIVTTLGSFDTLIARVVDVSGTDVYVGTANGLTILDATDPGAITESGSFATAAAVNGIDIDDEAGRVVTLSDESGVIQVLQASDPANIDVLGAFTFATAARGFDIEGRIAYIANDSGGVQILRGDLVAESTATLLNDDNAALTVSSVTVSEDAGSASVTVTLDNEVQDGFTYDFTTNDGTATQPDDYTITSGTFTTGTAGETQTIVIPIIPGGGIEGTESFTVTLSNPVPLGRAPAAAINVSSIGTVTITEDPVADLAITKGDNIDPIPAGDLLTYTLIVTNNGPSPATLVQVTDPLPAGVTFAGGDVDGNAGNVTAIAGTVTADVGSLAVGASSTVTIFVNVDPLATGTLSNTATVGGNESDSNVANNSATETTDIAVVNVDLQLAGDGVDPMPLAGAGYTETFTVANISATEATNVVAIFDLDVGANFQSGSSTAGTVVANPAGTQVTVSIATLAASGSDTIVLNLIADSDAASGSMLLTSGSVTSDEIDSDPVNNDALETATIPDAIVAFDDVLNFDEDEPDAALRTIDVTANDSSPLLLTIDSVSVAAIGVVTIVGGGASILYTPNPDAFGQDIISYTVSDPLGQTDTANLTVNIASVNDPPIAMDDALIAPDRGPFTFDVSDLLGNDSPGPANEGQTLTISNLPAVSINGGSIALSGSTITYTPNGAFTGLVDTFQYDVSDDVEVASATVTITLPPMAPTTLTGHVFCDFNGDGNAIEPVVNTTVFLDANGNRVLDPLERSTQTDTAGNYSFSNVIDPTLTVVAQVPPTCVTIPQNPAITRNTIEVGEFARSIDSTDIDGDGDQDLLIASDDGFLTVLTNVDGNFSVDTRIELGSRPQSVFAYRPPEAALPLVAVAGIGTPSSGGSVFTLQGTEPDKTLTAGNGPIEVVVDNFDNLAEGEVKPDILAAAFRSSDLRLFLNGSDEAIVIATARLIRTVATGDVDHDGDQDIIVGGFGYPGDQSSEMAVLLGDGLGGFSEPIEANPIQKLVSVKAAKLTTSVDNNDARVLALSEAGQMSIYRLLAGELVQSNSVDVARGATSFDVGDFNRDGLTDFAIANLGAQTIELFIGNGLGQFTSIKTISNVSAPSDIVVDDFDGDMSDDIGVANLYQDLNFGQGTPQYRLPSAATIIRVNFAEESVVISGSTSTVVNFEFQLASVGTQFDVSGDGQVSALDALQVINSMQQVALEGEQPESTDRAKTDVNGDGRTSAIDALMIINFLARNEDPQAAIAGVDQFVGAEDGDDDRHAAIDVVLTHLLV